MALEIPLPARHFVSVPVRGPVGRRDSASGDSGVAGRIYSMLAEERGISSCTFRPQFGEASSPNSRCAVFRAVFTACSSITKEMLHSEEP